MTGKEGGEDVTRREKEVDDRKRGGDVTRTEDDRMGQEERDGEYRKGRDRWGRWDWKREGGMGWRQGKEDGIARDGGRGGDMKRGSL